MRNMMATTVMILLVGAAVVGERSSTMDFIAKGRNAPTHAHLFGSGYYFIGERDLEKPKRIVFDLDFGSVIVRGAKSKEASLEAVFVADTPIQATGEEYLNLLDVQTHKMKDGWRIIVGLHARSAPPADLYFILKCHKETSLVINTDDGDVSVEDMEEGRVEVVIGQGNLQMNRVSSLVTAVVRTGDIDASIVPVKGVRYAFETRSGNLSLSVPASSSVSFETTAPTGYVDMGLPLSELQRPGGTSEWRSGLSDTHIILKTGTGNISVRGI
jgi:hypothetical protein